MRPRAIRPGTLAVLLLLASAYAGAAGELDVDATDPLEPEVEYLAATKNGSLETDTATELLNESADNGTTTITELTSTLEDELGTGLLEGSLDLEGEASAIQPTGDLGPHGEARAEANETLLKTMLELRDRTAVAIQAHKTQATARERTLDERVRDAQASRGQCLLQAAASGGLGGIVSRMASCSIEVRQRIASLRADHLATQQAAQQAHHDARLSLVLQACDTLEDRLERVRERYDVDEETVVLDPDRYAICPRAQAYASSS